MTSYSGSKASCLRKVETGSLWNSRWARPDKNRLIQSLCECWKPNTRRNKVVPSSRHSCFGKSKKCIYLLKSWQVDLCSITSDWVSLSTPTDCWRRLRSNPKADVSPATVLATVSLLEQRKQYDLAEKLLASKKSGLSEDEWRNAQLRLVGMLLVQGQSDRAKWALVELAKVASTDLRPIHLLIELAADAGDIKGMEHWEQRLKDLEGPDGTHWRFYRGEKLVRQALEPGESSSTNKYLEEARRLQEEIERIRPAWAAGYLLKAKLHQVPSNRDENAAIDAYEQALRLGEKRPYVIKELSLGGFTIRTVSSRLPVIWQNLATTGTCRRNWRPWR